MAVPPHPLHTHELLDRTAVWELKEETRLDWDRICRHNTALSFHRTDGELIFCLLISRSASHVATVSASDTGTTCTITTTVFRIGDDGFNKKWSATHALPSWVPPPHPNSYRSSYESHYMHGGVTDDGESLMLVFRPKHGATKAFTATQTGFVPRIPPGDTAERYSVTSGVLSDDGECILYTKSLRSRDSGNSVQHEAVEIYSMRSLVRLRVVSFSFGDGHNIRNMNLMSPMRLVGPLYIAIGASSFADDDKTIPPINTSLIGSSDGKVHTHVSGVDITYSPGTVSPDGAHLVCIDRDEGLRYWDLTKPTLKPLGGCALPGILYGQQRKWRIYGQETTIRDAVPDQLHTVRFSPACKVVTVVTASPGRGIIINSFLTFNLQHVYHKVVPHAMWPGLQALRIGFSEQSGLTLVAMSPTTVVNKAGVSMVVGVLGAVVALPDEFDNIKKVEDYFDHGSTRAARFESISRADSIPECRFSWRPGAMERLDADAAIAHDFGALPVTSAVDARRQSDFYGAVFANPRSSVKMASTPEVRRFIMPHLLSFSYPWAPHQTVSIFGVVMKHQYHILAIGPAPGGGSNGSPPRDVIRVLYANDIKTSSSEGTELIEFYKSSGTYILYVSTDKANFGYSGAPMPRLRRTVASPHFTAEDGWYDTFVLHASRHVTMPTGWSSTPNPAIMATSSIHAYFEPGAFGAGSEHAGPLDYGLRTRAAYNAPKYLLWKEYGLRGGRKARSSDVLFGGGQYADSLGPWLRSMYDDRTYDDSESVPALFVSSLALTCHVAHRSRGTRHIDAFFRRLHQEDGLMLRNAQTVSCALPLACRVRPTAALALLRHIVLFPFKVNDIGVMKSREGGSSDKGSRAERREAEQTEAETEGQHEFSVRMRKARAYMEWAAFWLQTAWLWMMRQAEGGWRYGGDEEVELEPNTKHVTLPLQGFCCFGKELHRAAPRARYNRDDAFWEFVRATTPYDSEQQVTVWERQALAGVAASGKSPASPFTRLVEEILDMSDRETQLSFLQVVWMEKLLAWKLDKFGLRIFLTRSVLPIVLLFVTNLAGGVLLTESNGDMGIAAWIVSVTLAAIEGLVAAYILYTKARQLTRVPRLFLTSVPNYVDAIALSLGVAMSGMVVSGQRPSREFLAFSTLLMWVAAILMLRIYKPVGMLLLLLTETIQAVFPFLALLIFIIIGFAFVPFLLLRNREPEPGESNIFSSFPLTIAQMISFVASDYDALQPFEGGSAAVRTLKALYIVVITILFLNTLIAILNLKIKRADKNAANLYHLQMASLQVQIELGLLSAAERARRDWFPEWFSYIVTETEERVWKEFLEKNPLRWTRENSFPEDQDHAPRPLVNLDDETSTAARSAPPSGAAPAPPPAPATGDRAPAAPPSSAASSTPSVPPVFHNQKPVTEKDLLSELEPFDVGDLPDPSTLLVDDESSEYGDDGFTSSTSSVATTATKPPPATTTTTAAKTTAASAPKPAPASPQASTTSTAAAASESIELTSMKELPCAVCGKPGSRCTNCRTVAYCTKEHQKQHWKIHRADCKGKARAV